jgi:hypothetical protein
MCERRADLPWMGCAVRLELHVRRFFCSNKECTQQIFTERLPTVVAPYARRTTRLTDVFTLIGFALGGEAGARLVAGMGLFSSPDTLLRLIRAQPEEQAPTPRVLGVDDFSFCKRKSYGTILIDLERRVPIDLLPDREAATFKKWLEDHPGEHPTMPFREIAQVCYLRFGRRPGHHSVQRVIASGLVPTVPNRRYPSYMEIPDPSPSLAGDLRQTARPQSPVIWFVCRKGGGGPEETERNALQKPIREWVFNYNHQRHWGHESRQDGCHTPLQVLDWHKGQMYPPAALNRILFATRYTRHLDRHGYVKLHKWRFCGETGLARQPVTVWIYDGQRIGGIRGDGPR